MSDSHDGVLRERLREIAAVAPGVSGDIERILKDPGPDGVEPQVEVLPARNGTDSLRINGKWVHSSFDPEKEARRRVQAVVPPRQPWDGVILVGLGLGYFCEALRRDDRMEAFSGSTICLVFHPAELEAAVRNRPSQWWLAFGPDRIVPAWLPGLLVPILQHHEIRSFGSLPVTPLRDLYPEMTATVETILEQYRDRTEVNRNTLRRFGRLWVRNTIRSIRQFGILPGVDHLVHFATGTPVVVCAAGPTLDDTLPELERHIDQALIIAVDTAVIALQTRGIEPDLAVISDPQYWNTRHLDQISPTPAVLVAEPATHPRTLRLWPGPAMMSASLFPLGSYIDSRTQRHLKLGSGGSVATSAWDLARVIGSTSIALAGADLGFPRYRTHCRGSFFETRLATAAHRLQPAEHGLWRYLHGAQAVMVPSAGGPPVPSDARMRVYRSWFSERPLQFPDVSTVVLSPESSEIPGIPFESGERWFADHGDAARVAAARHHLRNASISDPVDAGPTLRDLLSSLHEMEQITGDGLDRCRVLRHGRSAASDPPLLQRLAWLDEIDQRLGALGDREIVGFIAGSLLEEISAGHASTAEEALNQAETLYRTLHDAATFHIDLLKRYDFP